MYSFNFLLAFFTPFITGAIDFRYGYVFAGCNLLGAAIVYFFLMESAGKTLEELDYMYIIGVNPRKSSKWNPSEAGDLITTDNLFLGKGGRTIVKRNEADREGVEQDEGLMVSPGNQPGVTEVQQNNHSLMSSGAA